MAARIIIAMLVALSPLSAFAQETPWEKYTEAGLEAHDQARYAEAEEFFLSALTEAERFGDQDPRFATSLGNLAMLYHTQGSYDEAEPLYQHSYVVG